MQKLTGIAKKSFLQSAARFVWDHKIVVVLLSLTLLGLSARAAFLFGIQEGVKQRISTLEAEQYKTSSTTDPCAAFKDQDNVTVITDKKTEGCIVIQSGSSPILELIKKDLSETDLKPNSRLTISLNDNVLTMRCEVNDIVTGGFTIAVTGNNKLNFQKYYSDKPGNNEEHKRAIDRSLEVGNKTIISFRAGNLMSDDMRGCLPSLYFRTTLQ